MSVLPPSRRYSALTDLFEEAGFPRVEPAILQPSSLFLDLIGEDVRGRMYLASDTAGAEELCLRPDYTIPVCRAHLDGPGATTPARYSYCGPVFRQRREGSGEFMQAGVECFGRADELAADADVLALALQALSRLGVDDAAIHVGDEALYRAVLDGLGLAPVWRRRLGELFGERDRLDAAIASMTGGRAGRRHAGARPDARARRRRPGNGAGGGRRTARPHRPAPRRRAFGRRHRRAAARTGDARHP